MKRKITPKKKLSIKNSGYSHYGASRIKPSVSAWNSLYNGENISQSEYIVIMIARQVLTVELAEEIQKLIDISQQRESEYAEICAYAAKFKKAGIGVDDNYRVYQTKPEPDPIDESDFATKEEVNALINETYSN